MHSKGTLCTCKAYLFQFHTIYFKCVSKRHMSLSIPTHLLLPIPYHDLHSPLTYCSPFLTMISTPHSPIAPHSLPWSPIPYHDLHSPLTYCSPFLTMISHSLPWSPLPTHLLLPIQDEPGCWTIHPVVLAQYHPSRRHILKIPNTNYMYLITLSTILTLFIDSFIHSFYFWKGILHGKSDLSPLLNPRCIGINLSP